MNKYFTILLIVFQIQKLNGERSASSILHILNGKRSSQTILDTHLFGLSPFFGLYEKLSRKNFEQIIDFLINQHYITEKDHPILTLEGEIFLKKEWGEINLTTYLNGWKYHHVEESFLYRLQLMTQVLSHTSFSNRSYIPIIKDKKIHLQIKQLLHSVNKNEYANRFYKELYQCSIVVEKEIDPSFVLITLSGYKKSGKTFLQAAQYFQMEMDEYLFYFKSVLHGLVEEITNNPTIYPILHSLVTIDRLTPISQSTLQTEQLLNQGYSLVEISNQRNLKLSTIEDHLVELTMFRDDFRIEPYVSKVLYETILLASEKLNTKKLKKIKEVVTDATYLQIRLTLAKGSVK